jgi:HAD superfamily hydrolase (TIGR01549 family)
MPTIRAVIFDLDQTLVDSSTLAGWRKAGMWTFVRANLAQVRPYSSSLRPAHELPAHFRAQGLKVGIVTSSPRWYAEALTKSFHIECDCLVTYEDTEQHKPDPAPLHEALRLLGVDAAEACYVGDDPIDVQASYHAHVVSVGAAWGGEKGRLASAAPDILAPRPDALPPRRAHSRRGGPMTLTVTGAGRLPAVHLPQRRPRVGRQAQCGRRRRACAQGARAVRPRVRRPRGRGPRRTP